MILLLEVFRKLVKKLSLVVFVVGFCGTATCAMSESSPSEPEVVVSVKPGTSAKQGYVFGRTKVRPAPSRTTEAAIISSVKKIKRSVTDGYGVTFTVTNKIGRKVFVVPFAHIKRFVTDAWHWFKAPILELDVDQSGFADIGTLPAADDLTTVFGVLRICATREEAEAATYQLTQDAQKVDLDLLSLLNGKGVALHSSKYGVEGERLSYEIIPSHWKQSLPPLDFSVFNSANQPIFVTAFFYGKEQDEDEFAPWRFTKSDVYRLEPGKSTVVKVETIKDPYDLGYLRGFLGVFKEDEAKKSENSTYELLTPHQKIGLGPLISLGNKQVVISSRSYGSDTLFDITTRPAPRNGAAKLMAAV